MDSHDEPDIAALPDQPSEEGIAMMLHYVTVQNDALVSHTGMHKTGCSGEPRLVLHVPGSS